MRKRVKELAAENREVIFCAVNLMLPLFIGAYIYVKVGQDSYFGSWIGSLFSISKVAADHVIWIFLRNWGGDFLWAYALFFGLYLSMRGSRKTIWPAMVLASICAVFIESLQLIQLDFLNCGTFDVLDIAIELSAICIGAANLYCICHINRKKEKEKI